MCDLCHYWALLMEKSLAKYEGGYSNLTGDLLDSALRFPTGKKCTQYRNEDFSEKWPVLFDAIKSKNIICAGSLSKEGKTNQDDSDGIYYGHAYSILNAKHFSENGNNLKMLLLRNPWSHKEWQEYYLDNFPLWKDELKSFFDYVIVRTENGI